MLVHRRARRTGLGEALLRAAERVALERGRTLLVLDAVTGGDAERLYGRLGWTRVGSIPEYALMPFGGFCSTTVFYRRLEQGNKASPVPFVLVQCGSRLCGSLQARWQPGAARGRQALAPAGVEIVLFDGVRDLPLFNPDLESDGELDVVRAWRQALAGSDAVLIASPEYGFSLPGALKNAIDWVIGSGDSSRRSSQLPLRCRALNEDVAGCRRSPTRWQRSA